MVIPFLLIPCTKFQLTVLTFTLERVGSDVALLFLDCQSGVWKKNGSTPADIAQAMIESAGWSAWSPVYTVIAQQCSLEFPPYEGCSPGYTAVNHRRYTGGFCVTDWSGTGLLLISETQCRIN